MVCEDGKGRRVESDDGREKEVNNDVGERKEVKERVEDFGVSAEEQ